jgi:hypothetical protein
MRSNRNNLKVGKLIYLNAFYNNNVYPRIFTFVRKTPEETRIFVINLGNQEANFFLDLSSLLGKD